MKAVASEFCHNSKVWQKQNDTVNFDNQRLTMFYRMQQNTFGVLLQKRAIYIFIHQYGSAQKENTNIQKKQYKKHINHTQCAFTEQ